jgi:hypothetical protein
MSVVLPGAEHLFRVHNYNLRETLTSGQAFRWAIGPEESWESVVRGHWVRLIRTEQGIAAQAAEPISDWNWLSHYLQTEVDLVAILRTFPVDGPMQSAVAACAGLRLLRQDPWECLASFILSSTKQIVQIQQIVALVCERFGAPVAVPSGHKREFAFPTAERIAACTESELRACKMGFRAARRAGSNRPAIASRCRPQNCRLRAAVCLRISGGVSNRCVGHESIAPALFSTPDGFAESAPSFCRNPFRPVFRLCAAVFVSLHANSRRA